MVSRVFLAAEILVLFVGLPIGYRYSPVRIPALPVLWIVAGYALWQLTRDKSFDLHCLWNRAPLAGCLGRCFRSSQWLRSSFGSARIGLPRNWSGALYGSIRVSGLL